MAITVNVFKEDYPEFCSEDEDRLTQLIDRAALRLNEAQWGDCYDEAQGLVMAHLLARGTEASLSGGKGFGAKTSINVQDQYTENFAPPRSQSSSASSNSEYSTTVYGRQFLELQNAQIIPMLVI